MTPIFASERVAASSGVRLAGIAVKVTDGFFLLGCLMSTPTAAAICSAPGSTCRSSMSTSAIIAIEEGAPGERAFNEAFAAWGE